MRAQLTTDVATGSAAVSSPMWLEWLHVGVQEFVLIGGAILLLIRLLLSWQELCVTKWGRGMRDALCSRLHLCKRKKEN